MAILAATAATGAAQQQDTIRGHVLSSAGTPLAGARIVLNVQGERTAQLVAQADTSGSYQIVRASGPHLYLLTATSIGFTPKVDTVTRENADQHTFVVDFHLLPVVQALTAVRIAAPRRRPRRPGQDFQPTPGSTTNPLDLGNAATGDPTGGLATAMATLPGLTLIPDAAGGIPAISAFGLPSGQNSITLNGMNFLGEALPREGLRAQVVSSTYDPGQGGFGGAQVQLRMRMGGNGTIRKLHGTVEAPWLQWTPSGLSGVDNRYERGIANGWASGPIRLDHIFYSAVGQVSGRRRRITPLDVVPSGVLRAAGIDYDSAEKLLDFAQARGFPREGAAALAGNTGINGTAMLRVDYLPPVPLGGTIGLSSDYSLLIGANGGQQTGSGASPFALASTASHATDGGVFAQVGASLYPGGAYLTETYLTAGIARSNSAPDLIAPTAIVRAGSNTMENDPDAAEFLRLGGGRTPVMARDHASLELRNQTSWYSMGGKNLFQITLDLTADETSISRNEGPGTFTFETPANFSSGRPSAFQRMIGGGSRQAKGILAAAGVGSMYSPSSRFQIQYGIRGEYTRVASDMVHDPLAASALDVRTELEPSGITLAPMAGFSAKAGEYVMPDGATQPRFIISGGVREYTAPLTSASFAGVLGTGDPSQLLCIGPAAPIPDWTAYFDATAETPSQCRTGAPSTLSDKANRLVAYAPDFTSPRSWRAHLSTGTQISPAVSARVGVTAILNRRQLGTVDRNFSGATRFTLTNEDGRPVFVDPGGIDSSSGLVSPTTSRRTDQLGPVTQLTSTGALRGLQFTGSLGFTASGSPGVFGDESTYRLSYALNHYRQLSVGFAGSTAGDPRRKEWYTASPPAQVLVASATFQLGELMSVQAFARVSSGARFTPMVGSDINGDGHANDRAFVFDPLRAPSADTRSAMAALLGRAPRWATSCLNAQRGRIAGANSCVGPWSSTLNAVVSLDKYRLGFGNRGSIQFTFLNLLAGADALLHGPHRLHGWGQPAFPDATLLVVRGFDPATRTFQYDVNPFFGSSAGARLGFRAPFSVSVDVQLDVGPNRESQWLDLLLRPAPGDSALTTPKIRQRIARPSASVYDAIISMRDSLGLDSAQVTAISGMAARYAAFRDSVYDELAVFLSSLHGDFGGSEARDHWHSAIHQVNRDAIVDAPAVRRLLTSDQYRRLPPPFRYRLELTAHEIDLLDRGPEVGIAP